MSRLGVLAARDFITRARGGAYIATTILGILLLIGVSFGPSIIEKISSSFHQEALDLYVVDNTGEIYPLIAATTEEIGSNAAVRGELLEAAELPAVDDPSFGGRAAELLRDSGKDGLLVIDPMEPGSYSPASFILVLYDTSNLIANESSQDFLDAVVRRANAQRLNLTSNEIALLWASAPVRLQQLIDAPGEEASTEEVTEGAFVKSMVLAYILLFALYMAMILYGNMIASGVAEEKSSRIMEIMVSSVRPIELMAGKIIGIGSLGLLQFAIWIVTGLGLSALAKSGILKNTVFGSIEISDLPLGLLVWFGVFFVLGFVLYATVFAAAGASVSRVEEVNQVSTMIMMAVVVAFIIAYYSFINPNSTLSVVASMIPWLAPMVMFSRIALGNPTAIQIVVSLALLGVAVVLSAWVGARIYRVGVLMYGKRPSLREVLRYVREP